MPTPEASDSPHVLSDKLEVKLVPYELLFFVVVVVVGFLIVTRTLLLKLQFLEMASTERTKSCQ